MPPRAIALYDKQKSYAGQPDSRLKYHIDKFDFMRFIPRFSFPQTICPIILASLVLTACSNDVDPLPSAGTTAETPAIQAEIDIATRRGQLPLSIETDRFTQIEVRLFDLSNGNKTPITLDFNDLYDSEGQPVTSATVVNSGEAFDFTSDIRGWRSAVIASATTAPEVVVSHNIVNGSLQIDTTWQDEAEDIVAASRDLFRVIDLDNGSIDLDVYIPQEYKTDGKLQIRFVVGDRTGRAGWLKTVTMENLTGDSWNSISTGVIDPAQIDADDDFDITQVRFVDIELISNNKPLTINSLIQLDNINIAVQPTERISEFSVFEDVEGNPLHLSLFLRGGVAGRPLTVNIERSTIPENPWFPTSSSFTPNFDDLLFSALNSSVDLPVIGLTAPSPSIFDDESTHYAVGTDNVTIEWTPSGSSDDITIDYINSCNHESSVLASGNIDIADDPGIYTLLIDDFLQEQVDGDNRYYETSPCLVSIWLVKQISGSIDPAFSGDSYINAVIETDAISFYTIPSS